MLDKEEVKDLLNKCDNCKLKQCEGCEFTYTDIQKIKKYVESLELTNETWQVSNEMFREKTKELEQKESILDKVIDKLKETIKIEREFMKDTEHKSMAFHYSNGREVSSKEILEIIEGEKK